MNREKKGRLFIAIINLILGLYLAIISLILGLYLGYRMGYREPILIEWSSDSEPELAGPRSPKADTTITEVLILGTDTVYPTTHFKLLKR